MRAFPPIDYWLRRVDPTHMAPVFALAYAFSLLVVSLYPFTGWRFTGEPVLAFYAYPLPFYFTLFDNLINVLAYVPLGVAVAMLFRQRWLLGMPLALVAGGALSASVEFLQQFLPDRVASNMDLLSNAFGAWLGGMLAATFVTERWQRRWFLWRYQLFAPGVAVEWALVWLVFWFITQFDPSQPFLGVVVEPRGLPQPFVSPIDDPALFLRLLEGGGVLLNLLGVSLYVSLLMRHPWQRPRAIALVLVLALLVKLGFAGMLLKPAMFFAWINLNVVLGGALGLLLLQVCWRLRQRWRAGLGLLCLLLAGWVSWLWPLTPQLSAMLPLFRWQYGHLLHFNGLSHVVADLWPFGAMLFLLVMLLQRDRSHEF